jgi:chromosome segregation ATPase
MTAERDAIELRIEALAAWLLRDREVFTERELVTVLRASLEDATREIRDELVDAMRAHDVDAARHRAELDEAKARIVQIERERDRAREELEELRVLATSAIDELRDQLADATDVSAAALAAIAGQEVLCDGSGTRRAHAVVDGRVQRFTTPHPCPGCVACKRGGDDELAVLVADREVHHG